MMNELKVDSDGEGLRIAIVQARFNESIGEAQREACLKELLALGVDLNDIVAITVPGALEIPLALSQLAETGRFRCPDRAWRCDSWGDLSLRNCFQ